MKLYLCNTVAVDHEFTDVIAAKTSEEALAIFTNGLDGLDNGEIYFGQSADEIKIDGYDIHLTKKGYGRGKRIRNPVNKFDNMTEEIWKETNRQTERKDI